MVSLGILVVGVASGAFVTRFSPWSAAVVTAPAPLASKARAGANGTKVFFLPLFSHVVRLPIIVTRRLMRVTLEFSFSIPEARAAHHLAVLSLTIPFLANLVVHAIVMAPLR